MLRTEADLIRSLEGTWTLAELHRLVEDAGIAGRDRGYDRIQDGKHRWKRRVRSTLQTLKKSGKAHRVGDGTWVLDGTPTRPVRALLVICGEPTEIELVLGEAEEILRRCEEPIDLILADSPWALERGADEGRIEHAYVRDSTKVIAGYCEVPEDEYQEFTYRWVTAAAGALQSRGGYLAAVTGPQQSARIQVAAEDAGLNFVNQIVSKRPFSFCTTRQFSHAHVVVTVLCTGPAESKTRYFACPPDLPKAQSGRDYPLDIWTDVPKYERQGLLRYDNALPPTLVRRVVKAFTPAGALVADPFLGSGTTAVVALTERRRFYGGDLNPEALRFTMGRIIEEELGVGERLPLAAFC